MNCLVAVNEKEEDFLDKVIQKHELFALTLHDGVQKGAAMALTELLLQIMNPAFQQVKWDLRDPNGKNFNKDRFNKFEQDMKDAEPELALALQEYKRKKAFLTMLSDYAKLLDQFETEDRWCFQLWCSEIADNFEVSDSDHEEAQRELEEEYGKAA